MANKTEDLPGVEGEGVSLKRIKKLDDAISDWNEVKEKRMRLTEKEIETKAQVLAVMLANDVKRYRYDDDHEVILAEMVKSRKIETNGAGDE